MSAVLFGSFVATLFMLLPLASCMIYYLFEWEACRLRDGGDGICRKITDCTHAFPDLRKKRPVTCNYIDRLPIVCCPLDVCNSTILNDRDSVATTTSKSHLACMKYTDLHDSLGTPEIVNGAPVTSITDFPFVAALGYEIPGGYSWKCGGMLISKRFVLTAAHCDRNDGPQVVRLGAKHLHLPDSDSQLINVTDVIPHPCYDSGLAIYDIALLKLAEEITLTHFVFPACLPTSAELSNATSYTVLGWGLTSNVRGRSNNQTLQKTQIMLWKSKDCADSWKNVDDPKVSRGIDGNLMVCANDPNFGNSTCRGDSGGPLYLPQNSQHFTVVGVTSHGPLCGDREIPVIYSRIFPFLPWIEGIVWP